LISASRAVYSRETEKFDRRAVPQRNNKPGQAAGFFEARMASGYRVLAICRFTICLLL
jgi:hypothetical protein